MLEITPDVEATEIAGQTSSKLSLAVGVNILSAVIGGFGGNIGLNTSYTNAERVEFKYVGARNDFALPLSVGHYLRDANIDADNPVLREYVLGNGELFVITKTVKSRFIRVTFERKSGTSAEVKLRQLEDLIGGNVNIDSSQLSEGTITFTGNVDLVFGFQCMRVGVVDGDISLTAVRAGNVVLAAPTDQTEEYELLNPDGFATLTFSGE